MCYLVVGHYTNKADRPLKVDLIARAFNGLGDCGLLLEQCSRTMEGESKQGMIGENKYFLAND